MIDVGKYSSLEVLERVPGGFRLGDAEDSVFIPKKLAPKGVSVGQKVKVFVYTDSEDKPVATTEEPKATVGEFALLEVIDLSRHGAFVDWGLPKDLIVPTREQHEPLKVGDKVVLAVMLDRDGRVMGTSKLAAHFDKHVRHLSRGDKVHVLVYGFSERGIRVVANGRHSGMLFRDQTFRTLEIGDTAVAWITEIRPDGRLDLDLRAPGRSSADDARSILIAAIKGSDGFLALTDRSSPEQIKRQLQMSKKVFKRAVGALYKERKIAIEAGGLRWVE